MKNLIPGTYNQGKTGKKLNLYARRFDTFEYEFEYKYYNSHGVLVTGDLTDDVLVQANIKQSNKHNAQVLKRIPVYLDRPNKKIRLMLTNKENDLVEGKYYYDVEILFGGKNITYLSGYFIVLPQVTDWKDYYKLDYEVNLSNSIDSIIINPNNLYDINLNTKISYSKEEVIKQDSSIGNKISYELIEMPYLAEHMKLNSSISYEYIPVLVSYEVYLAGSFDYLRNIAYENGSSLTSKIEYEIF